MKGRATVVLDVGKTLSKLTLWAADGVVLERRQYANRRVDAGGYLGLDAAGIESWLADALSECANRADVGAIIPTGHGAAAAVIREGRLVQPPLDYEHAIPASMQRDYAAQREPFALTGSPALPEGLNLGAQLHFLETLDANLFSGSATLLPWAQYWSWLLSGVPASEVTTLGCHTDLWYPLSRTPSALSIRRGWAARMAPLRSASEVLGSLTPAWVARTGLPADVHVHCGLHDSNAALVAARAHPELTGRDATVLSTGTWFISMRTPAADARAGMNSLDEARDCLVNVDVRGNPVPSARFMGGREIERISEASSTALGGSAMRQSVPDVIASGAMILPTFAPGCGPWPQGHGRWVSLPTGAPQRQAAVALYAALVADASLDLIGATDCLLVEGRFARAEVFVRALATLRPGTRVHVAEAESDVSFGALRLIDPHLMPRSSLTPVVPLEIDLSGYRDRWRQEAARVPR